MAKVGTQSNEPEKEQENYNKHKAYLCTYVHINIIFRHIWFDLQLLIP